MEFSLSACRFQYPQAQHANYTFTLQTHFSFVGILQNVWETHPYASSSLYHQKRCSVHSNMVSKMHISTANQFKLCIFVDNCSCNPSMGVRTILIFWLSHTWQLHLFLSLQLYYILLLIYIFFLCTQYDRYLPIACILSVALLLRVKPMLNACPSNARIYLNWLF